MALPRPWLALVPLLLACRAAPHADSQDGLYVSGGSLLELHRGPDGALRGYLRTDGRIGALAPVEVRAGELHANVTYDDGTRAEISATLSRGPVLVLDGHEYRRAAAEEPADATVRREIEEAYARLAKAVETKDFDAFQALRVAHFATIPPDGVPKAGPSMAERARGMLARIQPPITTTNDVLELTVRGSDAIATVRQTFTRMQPIEGTPHEIHTEVTQRETWTRTSDGWKLLFVDEVRDHLTLDDGRRMN
jgi:ketosteroid isomerase-like protein